MPAGAGTDNPYVYQALDYQDHAIRATVPWDDATHAINAPATVFRDADCVYTKVIVGPPSGVHLTLPVPAGTTVYTVAQMAAVGLTSVDQIIDTQITAIPAIP